jgi:hypothetical protein
MPDEFEAAVHDATLNPELKVTRDVSPEKEIKLLVSDPGLFDLRRSLRARASSVPSTNSRSFLISSSGVLI